MREIKFRGKRVDNDEWIYGHYSTSIETGDNGGTECYYRETSVEMHYINNILVYPKSLGEYIGIKDKETEREIYTDDVYIDEADNKYIVKIGLYDRYIFQGSMDETSYGVYLLYENGEKDPNLKLLNRLKYLSNKFDNHEI
jgi:hypothetical protein